VTTPISKTKCKHTHARLITEWNGVHTVAACLECQDCGAVCGMTPKDRKAADAMLAKLDDERKASGTGVAK
jgi:hypothetical protein